MKTIVEINSTNYASTGNISNNIAQLARRHGFNVITFCKSSKESKKHLHENEFFMDLRIERIISDKLACFTGLTDHFNILGTFLFIKKIESIKPDLIHIHVLHDNNINIKMFFKFLKKVNIPVVWTFHDCWPITGYCAYFDIVNCDKWKTGCFDCIQKKEFIKIFDSTKKAWKEKKELFTSVKNLTIVTPSKWLAALTKKSYFKDNNIRVINNGIDLDLFKQNKGQFREKYNLLNKHIVLGVSNFWWYRKGLDVFVELSKKLPNNYQIVLVGTNDEVDKQLPGNIISIHRTYNQEELCEIYSDSDVFVNPTREENFPTVNIEALACGLPVITFNTGGSPEILDDSCGITVDKNDISEMKKQIIRVCENDTFKKEKCVERSKLFDKNDKFMEYIDLYNDLLKED